jgi:hypothetical protein
MIIQGLNRPTSWVINSSLFLSKEKHAMSETSGNGQLGEQKEEAQEVLKPPSLDESLPLPKPEVKTRAKRNAPIIRLPFPTNTLEEAINVSNIIKEYNGGKPYPLKDLAGALDISVGSNEFYRLLASSRDYGMTSGTTNAKQIVLEVLGRNIVYAKSNEDEKEAIWKAFFNVKLFKAIYDHYEGKQLKELKYLGNTLETEFGLPQKYHQEFYDVYTKNIQYLEMQGVKPSGKKEEVKTKAIAAGPAAATVEPLEKATLTAFIAMPFKEKTERYPEGFFNEVFTNLISPAAKDAGFKAETARKEGSDIIQSTIVNKLIDADLVIVDLTEHNPNVLFELGLRMAMEKPTILIKSKDTPAIFDVDNLLRVLDYDPRLWKSTLENDVSRLTNHIKGGWEGKEASQTYMNILKKHKEP